MLEKNQHSVGVVEVVVATQIADAKPPKCLFNDQSDDFVLAQINYYYGYCMRNDLLDLHTWERIIKSILADRTPNVKSRFIDILISCGEVEEAQRCEVVSVVSTA